MLAGREYKDEEILPEYYVRQRIEQLNDVAKNYTKLLPIRSQKEETYTGHIVLSMIATAVVRFIQLHLNDSELYLGSRFEALRSQKAILYTSKIVPEPPIKPANDVYKAFQIPAPSSLPIVQGKLTVPRPEAKKHFFKTPKEIYHRIGTIMPQGSINSTSNQVEETSIESTADESQLSQPALSE